ncbi:hypothetical protein [Tumebacillus flagellatus]|uniref:Phage baseplate protein n=1 Tax=Tumebacillus flagellatus TaxID=1157490 RepID=A0A074LKB3_9BACL|nr:hypothetical protein [Tumebacillus flagellatus]KEO81030.1 hypothetical protein EL26_22895 [Tumebacillus flagellatus]
MAEQLMDLLTDGSGDLGITSQGDVGLATSADSLKADLVRRFGTPLGALFYDPNFGNPMLSRLSQPMSQGFEAACSQDARACVMADARVLEAGATVFIDRENRRISCVVEYRDVYGGTGRIEEVKVLV